MFTTQIWTPSLLIAPANYSGYVEKTEVIVPFLLVLTCSFILPEKNEIELALVCGTSSVKLFFTKALPVYLYSIAPAYLMLALYKYAPYDVSKTLPIPIYIPEKYKLYLGASLFVSITFFFALFCFIRVLTRNCYAPLFICMLISAVTSGCSKDIQILATDIRLCLIDPFISIYMLGDTVPNAMTKQFIDLPILKNAWTYNRICFFVVSLVLFYGTCLLLRREKLHRGFGD